jgi:release factor glutamine methyltransferase
VTARPTPREALAALRVRFAQAGLDTPELDARLLVAAALRATPQDVLLGRAPPLVATTSARLEDFAARRLAGEPVARILGRKGFWTLDLVLGPDTLVPRPETEIVVEAALDRLRSASAPRIADLGVGSGAILLALLAERADASGIGVDRSQAALAVAADNAAAHGLAARALLVRGDWAEALAPGTLDLLVSNPPYVASSALASLDPEVRDHDPRAALDGGADGLACYRALLPGARRALRPSGALVLEIGEDQAAAVTSLAADAGFAEIEGPLRDLAGRDRVLVAAVPA